MNELVGTANNSFDERLKDVKFRTLNAIFRMIGDINMFRKFSSTELIYIKKFTENFEDDDIIRFYDKDLEDMYMHNFTLIKNRVCKDKFRNIILKELEKRKAENANFLRVEFNFSVEDEFINDLPVVPKIVKYDYMYIEPKMSGYLLEMKGSQ